MLFRFWVFPDCTFLDISRFAYSTIGVCRSNVGNADGRIIGAYCFSALCEKGNSFLSDVLKI